MVSTRNQVDETLHDNERDLQEAYCEIGQQGEARAAWAYTTNQRPVSKSFRRIKAMNIRQREKERDTYPSSQTTAPTAERRNDRNAKGNPIKKPRGLHLTILPVLSPPRLMQFPG